MKLNIKIDSNTDLNKVLDKIKRFETQVKSRKKRQRTKVDLSSIQLKSAPMGREKSVIYVPYHMPDGTMELRPMRKSLLSMKAVNDERVKGYYNTLINYAYSHPHWTFAKLEKQTKKRFMEDYKLDALEYEVVANKKKAFANYLEDIGLGKENIAQMLKEDLNNRKGNRDRLIWIALDMWKSIDAQNGAESDGDSKKVIEMMKKVIKWEIEYTPKIDKPTTVENVAEEATQEKINTDTELKDSVDINQLIEKTNV